MAEKTWYIIVEKKEMIGNPIVVEDLENDVITDTHGNKLKVIGIIKDWKLAKKEANYPDRSIYVLQEGSKQAWYKNKR